MLMKYRLSQTRRMKDTTCCSGGADYVHLVHIEQTAEDGGGAR